MTDKSLGLGKLLAKSKSTIRRARRGSLDDSNSLDSDDAHSSIDHPSRGHSDTSHLSLHSPSEDIDEAVPVVLQVPAAVGDKDEIRESSTSLTSTSYDSDNPDMLSPARPIASNHPSQIGYLTTNSPLIQHEYYHDTSSTDSQRDHEAYPAGLAPPTSRSSRRSPSPVGRIKNAFRSKKSLPKLSRGSSDTSSPERRPTSSDSRRSADFKDGPFITHSSIPDLPRGRSETEAGSELSRFSNDGIEVTREHKGGQTERISRLSQPRAPSIDTSSPPGTPSDKGTPPVIVNTPPTPTKTTSPRFDLIRKGVPTEAGKILQRRGRADSASIVPSKLSTISSAPLTPIESVAATPTNQSSGFFTSVFSAAQSAAQNLSNTISNSTIGPGNPKIKSAFSDQSLQKSLDEEDKVEVEPSAAANLGVFMEAQEPAVKTFGTGDLSLSQLGIETMSSATTPVHSRFPDHSEQGKSRPESAPTDFSPVQPAIELPWDEAHRPQSLYDSPAFGTKTPPTGDGYDEGAGIHRSGSIRSAIGGRRSNRKRGSTSGTGGTGNTIGAALSAVNTSLAQPGAQPKLTGFAVASKRRNRDFHELFKSVPDDDYLIEDYSCALQREILAHGRLYVSEGHLCFSSNILGWVTTLVMSFDEIVSVEKRSTALLFKNGLMISTLHAKHIFASFTSRDSTYDLIVKIWKLGHPGLQSSLNGVRLDETGGDKTEKIDAESIVDADGSQSRSASASDDEDASEDGDDVYDEDEEEDEDFEPAQAAETPLLQSSAFEKSVTRKPSGAVGVQNTMSEKPKDAPAAPAGVQDFPGPATHAATDCGDADTHYKRVTGDDVIPAPLGKVFDMLFGPNSAAWMANFLTKDQKCQDLQMEDKKGLSQDHDTRAYSYIKPLNGAIGPKQTKCLISDHLEALDLEHAVRVLVTTQTPDVPSGNVFSVKTKYCLTWAENNATRVQINCVCEWTGKSWLKGPIENGANEGQSQFCKDLFVALKAAVSKRTGGTAAAAGGKGRKKGKKGKASQAANVTSDSDEPSKASSKHNWGALEPLHDIIGPVLDIGKPLMTGNLLYGLLVGLLVTAWFGFGSINRPVARPYGSGLGLYGYPDRLAAYEEMWRREESELWEWLEERVGMERLSTGASSPRKRVTEPRTMEEKLREGRMDEREVKEAIKITEDRLKVLKSVVEGDR
ncbi:unnamed protein product [Discula destructiva]